MTTKQNVNFRPYTAHEPLCPITCITPPDGYYIHTFFDVCPWSPSGKYIVCLRLPFQDRIPTHEDNADICLIDLEEQTIETLYTTNGWAMQLGAHQCWGRTDDTLYFNDKRDGKPVGVKYDLRTRTATLLEGPVYQVAPDESYALSPCQIRTNHTQWGYGVTVAPEHDIVQPFGPSAEDGVYKVDLQTGKQSLLVNFAQIYEALPDKPSYEGGKFFGAHVKFNRQQTRIMFVVRWRHPEQPGKNMVVTFKPDGSDMAVAIPWQDWAKRGHHPDWHPDGDKVLMNLNSLGNGMQFYEAGYDGSRPRTLVPGIPGSGHPSWSLDGRYIVTDAYPKEQLCDDGLVPIRLIDVHEETERRICRMWTLGPINSELRVDPHPAWDRTSRQVCFVGAPDGNRQLFIADLRGLLS